MRTQPRLCALDVTSDGSVQTSLRQTLQEPQAAVDAGMLPSLPSCVSWVQPKLAPTQALSCTGQFLSAA